MQGAARATAAEVSKVDGLGSVSRERNSETGFESNLRGREAIRSMRGRVHEACERDG